MRSAWLLLLLLHQTSATSTLGFGVSLSLSGQWTLPGRRLTTGCFFCPDVVQALKVWEARTNSLTSLSVNLTILDDEASHSKCMQNYLSMAADNTVDFLFGPAYYLWNSEVANLVEVHGKVIILWSFQPEIYWSSYTTEACPLCRTFNMSFPLLKDAPFVAHANSSGWLRYNYFVDPTLEPPLEFTRQVPLPVASQALPAVTSFSEQVSSSPYAFDVNMPADVWTLAAMDSLVKKFQDMRARIASGTKVTMAFAWVDDYDDGDHKEQNCRSYHAFAVAELGVKGYMVPLRSVPTIGSDIYLLQGLAPDILLFCGSFWTSARFLQHYFTEEPVQMGALLLDQPMGALASLYMYGEFMKSVVEPMPIEPLLPSTKCSVFDDFDTFHAVITAAGGRDPSYGSLQAAAAGSLLVSALLATGSNQSDLLRDAIRISNFSTLLGSHRYNAVGQRRGHRQFTGMRQVLPSGFLDIAVTSWYSKLIGGVDVSYVVVSKETVAACDKSEYRGSQLCHGPFRESLNVPFGAGQAVVLESRHCILGAESSGMSCFLCPAGKLRDKGMSTCSDCPNGRYADVPGLDYCEVCPENSHCPHDKTPYAKDGFFNLEGNYSHLSRAVSQQIREIAERKASNLPPVPTAQLAEFWRCPGRACVNGSCAGMNTGLLCGMCKANSSTSGIYLSSGICTKCPSASVLAVYAGVGIGSLAVIGMLMSRWAYAAIYASDHLGAASLRIFIHAMTVVFSIVEGYQEDIPFLPYLFIPAKLLVVPIEWFRGDCWSQTLHMNTEEENMRSRVKLTENFHLMLFVLVFVLTSTVLLIRYINVSLLIVKKVAAQEMTLADVRFFQMHESFTFWKEIRCCLRRFACLAIMFSGMSLRYWLWLNACTQVGDTGEMYLRYSTAMTCKQGRFLIDDWEHTGFVRSTFTVPVVVAIALLIGRDGINNFIVSQTFSPLTVGYRSECFYWELVVLIRSQLSAICYLAPKAGGMDLVFKVLVVLGYQMLSQGVKPYSTFKQNWLAKMELWQSILMLILLALFAEARYFEILSPMSRGLILISSHIFVYAGFVRMLIGPLFLQPLRKFLDAGAVVSPSLHRVFDFFTMLTGGLNLIHMYKDKNGGIAIDHSQLQWRQRKVFEAQLNNIARRCINKGEEFQIGIVADMLHDSVVKAQYSQQGAPRHHFEQYGCEMHSIFGANVPFAYVTLRDPDLICKKDNYELGVTSTFGDMQIALLFTLKEYMQTESGDYKVEETMQGGEEERQAKALLHKSSTLERHTWGKSESLDQFQANLLRSGLLNLHLDEDTLEDDIDVEELATMQVEQHLDWKCKPAALEERVEDLKSRVSQLHAELEDLVVESTGLFRKEEIYSQERVNLAEERFNHAALLTMIHNESAQPQHEEHSQRLEEAEVAAKDELAAALHYEKCLLQQAKEANGVDHRIVEAKAKLVEACDVAAHASQLAEEQSVETHDI